MTAPILSPIFWLAVASTFALVGAVWQCILALLTGIESMEDFLGDQNRIVREERIRLLAHVPRWRLFKRRRIVREILADAELVLSQDERKRSRSYDRQAWAWSWVITGALIASIVSWIQLAS